MSDYRNWNQDNEPLASKAFPDVSFPTNYQSILDRIAAIDPTRYAKSRNFIDGSVTYLSPYISRGVISTKQVYDSLKERGFNLYQMEKMVSELAWRDFFQRVWQSKEEGLFEDIRQPQPDVKTRELPAALPDASTGIDAVDKAIENLLETGYMHNHVRMYLSSIACNFAGAYWKKPSEWLYYHLLDGDLASNTCSWQWVAAAFSGKKYYCNQDNISKYTGSNQKRSFLAADYGSFPLETVPETLQPTQAWLPVTNLPETPLPTIDPEKPLLLYTSYNLDPLWRKKEEANRVLLLEKEHFNQFPISEKVLDFIQALGRDNIEGLQIYAGSLKDLPHLNSVPAIYSKEHPAFQHFPGTKDARDWLVPQVSGYFSGFFGYWKKIEKYLK